jgi:Flp pilus assembly protein TadG
MKNTFYKEGEAVKMKLRKRKRREGGQSAVEMALTLPLLLLLIFGMLEMGWLASTRLVLDNITREGVRVGIVATSASANTSDVIDRINVMKPSYLTDPLTITVTYSNPSSFRDGDITVVTEYNLPPLTPLTAFLTEDGTFHLRSECTMKMS